MTYPNITNQVRRDYCAKTLRRWRSERDAYRVLISNCDVKSIIGRMDCDYFSTGVSMRLEWQYGFRLAMKIIGGD